MSEFLKFFFEFISGLILGITEIFGGIWRGILYIFNFKRYIDIFNSYSQDFTAIDWIAAIIAVILTIAFFVLIFYLIFLLIRKYIRFRKTLVEQEDLLEEVSSLHKQVVKLAQDNEKLMMVRLADAGVDISNNSLFADKEAMLEAATSKDGSDDAYNNDAPRFFRLANIDDKYKNYLRPDYNDEITLPEICESFRNFACTQMKLYYEINVIRLLFAGLASTKFIILQGISGTGKTSLPYSLGKFLKRDATMASVQPSWRDRTELFGYFNEFTKRFNETDVLSRIYDTSYNDDLNIIILDEMNIARVEYYFAEMLSVLELPDTSEWKIDLVSNEWPNDPKNLVDGKLKIPENMWYIGTANNDDSTFTITDKVYDRAFPINLDAKGVAFDAPDTGNIEISYSHLKALFNEAMEKYPVSEENLKKISNLDIYVIEKIRLAFGNRIIKQLKEFVPVYVACGGSELDGIDYVLATKIFRKFESLNLAVIHDELKGLMLYMDKTFGKDTMKESKAYLTRLQKMF